MIPLRVRVGYRWYPSRLFWRELAAALAFLVFVAALWFL